MIKNKKLLLILKFSIIGLILLLFASFPIIAQDQSALIANQENMLFQSQKWEESAKAYEAITKTEPDNGRAWYRLGISLHKLGQYEKAIMAYQRALEKIPEPNKPLAMYNIGASYAKLSDKDKSFEWITKAFNAGFSQIAVLNTDPDLQTIREDKTRFQELLNIVDRLTKPCLYQPEHKQFDFWIGEWDVQDEKGQPVGSSRIERIENGCILLENWDDRQGGTGKSLNFYDANLHKWRQTWADNTGGVSEFAGVYKDSALRFEGESHTPDGTKILRRLTFFDLGTNKVRQFSEASTDNGKTWSVNYDFIYLRKEI